ncbi:hypothetical protein KR044_010360, partial [Drosophila immigrans]
MLYASPIWAPAVAQNKSLQRKIAAPYRLSALRVISGFRTVSNEAALVLAGMIPVDILAMEMREVYVARKEMSIGEKYLFKYRHEDSPECPNCPDSEEDPEHVLYHCPRYSWMFQHPRPPEDLINYMLETEENWRNTCQLITGIQSDLRRCEKERRVRE